MELLSLEISKSDNQNTYDKIRTLTTLRNNSIYIKINSNSNKTININYGTKYASNKKKNLEEIYSAIVKIIIEHIIQMSYNYFEQNYSYFDIEEVSEIKKEITEDIRGDIKLKIIIKDKIKDFRTHSKLINLEGFIKFRLKFIEDYGEQVVEKCIDNYLMKKEYNEFINVLKYFSEYDNEEDVIINVLYNNNKIQIYDEKMNKINYCMNQEISEAFDEISLQYHENIINVLLAMTPKKIIIHTPVEEIDSTSKNTIEILRKVFAKKAELCSGCKYCR